MFPSHRYFHVPFSGIFTGIFTSFPSHRYFHVPFSQVFPCSLLTGISMFPSHRYFHVPFSQVFPCSFSQVFPCSLLTGIFTFPFHRYFHVVPFSQVFSCSLLIVSFWRSLLIKGMASHDYSNATFGVVLRVIPETHSIEINDFDYVVSLI